MMLHQNVMLVNAMDSVYSFKEYCNSVSSLVKIVTTFFFFFCLLECQRAALIPSHQPNFISVCFAEKTSHEFGSGVTCLVTSRFPLFS